jgi:predicted RNA-binding Zn ribbon-like protein
MLPGFEFIGGHEALDFSNTVAWSPRGPSNDRLVSYDRLLEWARRVSLVSPAESRRAARRAHSSPGKARAALERAVRVRAALHRTFSSVVRNQPIPRSDLKILNGTLRRSEIGLSAPGSGGEVSWSIQSDELLDIVTERVLWSGAQLLTSDDLSRIGMCDNEKCGWVFLDRSRNRSRRWCSMAECGSRAKSRRYYRRTRTKPRRA